MSMKVEFFDLIASKAQNLTESTSYQLFQQIQRFPLTTPFSATPIETSYVQQGQNHPPIVLLHGFDSSLMEFRRILPKLASARECWAVDLFGFGFSDRRDEVAVTPKAIKTHLYCFWKTLIERPIILLGASMGGAVAIDFAVTYPELVQQLILIDSVGFARGPAMGKLMIPPLDRLATAFLSNRRVRQKISENAYYDKRFANEDALCCSMLHLAHPNWAQALISFTKSGGYHLNDQIAQIQQPTLILWGEQDQILGTNDATRFEATIPNRQLIWIPESGHVPHLEKADLTVNIILEKIKN